MKRHLSSENDEEQAWSNSWKNNITRKVDMLFYRSVHSQVQQYHYSRNYKIISKNWRELRGKHCYSIGSTYLHIPLVLKFSTDRWNNVRPYVLAGVSYDHNFSSNQENSDDNFSGEFRMKTRNFMYELGVGVDIYLNFFKFSPSIRGVFAMNRELIDDNNSNSPWTSPINVFSTRGVFLNFAFE